MSSYLFAISIMIVAAVATTIYLRIDGFKTRRKSWDELVADIERVPREGMTCVAMDHLRPVKNQLQLEPEEMWNRLGGLEGILAMRHNADVVLALASYVQRWNFEEGVIVSERIRRDAVQLRKATFRITVDLILHRSVRIPFHLHEAASAYYLMTQRLLALYETSHVGLYPRLAEAL